jgi:hypothetical protein
LSDDPILDAVRLVLGARPTPEARRALAQRLDAIAEAQLNIASTEEQASIRVRAILARERANAGPRPKGGRPKGSGGRFIKVDVHPTRSCVVHIAPALLQELGSPNRVELSRRGNLVVIEAAKAKEGYSVTLPKGPRGGMPRISIGKPKLAVLHLTQGRHEAMMGDGVIIVSIGAA